VNRASGTDSDNGCWLRRLVSLRIHGVVKSFLNYCVCKLLGFALKLITGVFGIVRIPTLAIKPKARSVWERKTPTLGQCVTASGAEWVSYEKDVWYLLKSERLETETAVSEFLDYLRFPIWALPENIPNKAAFVNILTPLIKLGVPLPVEHIKRTYCTKYTNCQIKTMQQINEISPESISSDTSQNRVNADNAFGSLEPSADSGVAKIHGVATQANEKS